MTWLLFKAMDVILWNVYFRIVGILSNFILLRWSLLSWPSGLFLAVMQINSFERPSWSVQNGGAPEIVTTAKPSSTRRQPSTRPVTPSQIQRRKDQDALIALKRWQRPLKRGLTERLKSWMAQTRLPSQHWRMVKFNSTNHLQSKATLKKAKRGQAVTLSRLSDWKRPHVIDSCNVAADAGCAGSRRVEHWSSDGVLPAYQVEGGFSFLLWLLTRSSSRLQVGMALDQIAAYQLSTRKTHQAHQSR